MNRAKDYRVIFAAPGEAELVEVRPGAPPLGPTEVAGRTLATLISPGTELAVYQGQHAKGKFPCGSGYAAVFQVRAVGVEVADIKPADRVFCMGPHQSFQRVRREDVLPVPAGLAPQTAVFVRMMGVSMTTLATTAARPPAKVLVTGLGLVGHLAARAFETCGYEVIACDPVRSRRDIALQCGIRNVLPAVSPDDPQIAGRVALVVECSGHEQAVLDACRVVQKRGEVVLVGVPWVRRTDLSAHELLYAVFHKYVVLRSGWEWELPVHAEDFRSASIFGNFAVAMDWLAAGKISVEGLCETASPRDAQRVYQQLLHGTGDRLTTVFDWTDCP